MDDAAKIQLRGFLKSCLAEAGDNDGFADETLLFTSGRLDSLSMTKLVIYLEDAFGIDFGQIDFDVDLVDSVNDIQAFVDAESSQRI